MIEYPKMLYRGKFVPDNGLAPLDKLTVNSEAEEKAAAKDGFVSADDIETLIPDELKPKADPKATKKKKADDGE